MRQTRVSVSACENWNLRQTQTIPSRCNVRCLPPDPRRAASERAAGCCDARTQNACGTCLRSLQARCVLTSAGPHSNLWSVKTQLYRSLLAVALSVVVVPACESDPFQGELEPCRCETTDCSPQSCPIEVRLDELCAADMELAEILVDDHLEVGRARPGVPLRTCSRVPFGETQQVTIRGGPWVWGPLTERCDEPGAVRSLVLQCLEANIDIEI